MSEKIKILFVCMGNICRSPTAHGVFQHLVEQSGYADRIHVDSAGTHAYHISEPPDRRAQQAARRRDIDLSGLRARKAVETDFSEFDYILAMDRNNYEDLIQNCPQEHVAKVKLFLEFAPELGVREVPDPYYGGSSGFEQVLDLVDAASRGLLEHLRKKHQL